MVITNAEKDIAIDLKSVVQAAVDQTSRGLLKEQTWSQLSRKKKL